MEEEKVETPVEETPEVVEPTEEVVVEEEKKEVE